MSLQKDLRAAKDFIRGFIREHWDDQKLAAAYAWNADGNMRFKDPCGCLLGVTLSSVFHNYGKSCEMDHYYEAKRLHFGFSAEIQFLALGTDFKIRGNAGQEAGTRRRRMSALLRTEMRLRERTRKLQEKVNESTQVVPQEA